MKKLIFLLLLSTACLAKEPVFYFKDCVKVVNGFYKGCIGRVDSYNNGSFYYVNLSCKNETIIDCFSEKDLKASKECKPLP